MFRGMRRARQILPEAEAVEILGSSTSGVLAVDGDDGYPYAVPLSFAYDEGKLYFHTARTGHKLDAIARNPRVSFCVVAADDVVQDEFTTYYRSVIAFGRARVVAEDDVKMRALRCLAQKYSPDFLEAADAEIMSAWERLDVVEIDIDHLTGKAAIEVVTGGE